MFVQPGMSECVRVCVCTLIVGVYMLVYALCLSCLHDKKVLFFITDCVGIFVYCLS